MLKKFFLLLFFVFLFSSGFSLFDKKFIFIDDSNTYNNVFDFNNSDYNNFLWTQLDLNRVLQIPDFNNVYASRNWVTTQGYLTSFTELDPLSIHIGDNIWKLVLPADFNSLYKNAAETDPLSIHTSDSNNIGRLNSQVIANPPWLTSMNYADLNLNFVPYVGALYNVNLGDKNLFTDGNITASFFNVGTAGRFSTNSSPNRVTFRGLLGNGLSLGANGVNDYFYIDTNGKIGIGTKTPSFLLDLNGNSGTTNTIGIKIKNEYSGTNATEASIRVEADDPLQFGTLFQSNTGRTDGFANLTGFYTSANNGFSILIPKSFTESLIPFHVGLDGNVTLTKTTVLGDINSTGKLISDSNQLCAGALCYNINDLNNTGSTIDYSDLNNNFVPYNQATNNIDLNDKNVLNINTLAVGTTTPEKSFEVHYSNTTTFNPDDMNTWSGIKIVNDGNVNQQSAGIHFRNYNNDWYFGNVLTSASTGKGDFVFATADNTLNGEAMRITEKGRIGIGTTNPQNILNAVGDINATNKLISDSNQLCAGTLCYNINDLNNITNVDLSPYAKTTDVNASLNLKANILDVNAADNLRILISDSNNISRLNYQVIANAPWLTTYTDTNWQTSYPTLDANLALTFYKQSDLNNNGLFVKTSDSNNTGRLNYQTIANPPWLTSITPAGNDKEIQFNKSGTLGADSNLTYNYSTNQLLITNPTNSSSVKVQWNDGFTDPRAITMGSGTAAYNTISGTQQLRFISSGGQTVFQDNITPVSDNGASLGTSYYRWLDINAGGSITATKDINATGVLTGTSLCDATTRICYNIADLNNTTAGGLVVGDSIWKLALPADFNTIYKNVGAVLRTYTGISPVIVDNDANTIALNTYIPTEQDIDNNALGIINGLDLNNSLSYLKTVGYIPTEADIDNNALAVINSLDLNNSLSYLKTFTESDPLSVHTGASIWELVLTTDFNNLYKNSGGSGSGDLNQIDANQWYYKQTDLNTLIQVPDFNNVWVSWKDGNKTYAKTTDTNASINLRALITDVNGADSLRAKTSDVNASLALKANILDVNGADNLRVLISDSNNIGRLDYQTIANPPWLTTYSESDPYFYSRFTNVFDGNFYQNFKPQFDNNFNSAFQIAFDSNFAVAFANKIPIADSNISFSSDFNSLYLNSSADANNSGFFVPYTGAIKNVNLGDYNLGLGKTPTERIDINGNGTQRIFITSADGNNSVKLVVNSTGGFYGTNVDKNMFLQSGANNIVYVSPLGEFVIRPNGLAPTFRMNGTSTYANFIQLWRNNSFRWNIIHDTTDNIVFNFIPTDKNMLKLTSIGNLTLDGNMTIDGNYLSDGLTKYKISDLNNYIGYNDLNLNFVAIKDLNNIGKINYIAIADINKAFVRQIDGNNWYAKITDVNGTYAKISDVNAADNLRVLKSDLNNTNSIDYNAIRDLNKAYVSQKDGNAWYAPLDLNNTVWNVYSETKEPTGFDNLSTTNYSFSDSNRVFSLCPNSTSFFYWYHGEKITINNCLDITLPSTAGQTNWVYLDGNRILKTATTIFFSNSAQVTTVYYDGTKGVIGDERHGIAMDWATHGYLHFTVGTRYYDGLGGTFNDNNFLVTAGSITDEDLFYRMGQQLSANVYYKNGNSYFTWDNNQLVYYKAIGGALKYNSNNDLNSVNNNKYIAVWVFATNDKNVSIASIVGQREDSSLSDAIANNKYESLSFGQLPFQEMKLLYRVILQNKAGNPTWIQTDDYRSVSNLPAGTYVASSHSALTNLDYSSSGHTGFQAAITDLNQAYYTQVDANAVLQKITDTNNISRINIKAIADLNSQFYSQLDANRILTKQTDANNWFSKVSDVNGNFAKTSDVNAAMALRALITDVNGADALRLLKTDLNNLNGIDYNAIRDLNKAYYSQLDANRSLYKQIDANALFAKISDINSTFLRSGDVNGLYTKIADVNTWFAKTADINGWFLKQADFDSNFAVAFANKMPIADANITSLSWSKLLSVPTAFPYAKIQDINLTTDLNATFLKITDGNAAIALRARITDVNAADTLRALVTDVNGADSLRILISDTNNTGRINFKAIADLNNSFYSQLDANRILTKQTDANNWFAKVLDVNTWFAKTSDINSTFLRAGDVNGLYTKIADVNTWFARTTDVNAAIALRALITDVNGADLLRALITDVNGADALRAKTSDVNASIALKANILDVNGADNLRALITDVNGADSLRLLKTDLNNTNSIDYNAIRDLNKAYYTQKDLNNNNLFTKNSDTNNIARIDSNVIADWNTTASISSSAIAGLSSSTGMKFLSETITDANSTTFSFTGLDGNTASEYLIYFSIQNQASGATLKLRLNNDSTSKYSLSYHFYTGTDYQGMQNTTSFEFVNNPIQKDYYSQGVIHIDAKTGKPRFVTIDGMNFTDTGTFELLEIRGTYFDKTTNITSIDFVGSTNGIGAGSKFTLYGKG